MKSQGDKQKNVGMEKRIKCHYCHKPIKEKDLGGVAFHNTDLKDGKPAEIWFHGWLPCVLQFKKDFPEKQ